MTESSRRTELAKRYRTFALSARLSAATAQPNIRDNFTKIAEYRGELAIEAEKVVEEEKS